MPMTIDFMHDNRKVNAYRSDEKPIPGKGDFVVTKDTVYEVTLIEWYLDEDRVLVRLKKL